MTRILVIDDEPIIRRVLRMILEDEGFEVDEAEDGNHAINRYRSHPSDFIITDLIMPDKEGIETIIELRQEFPDVPIIAMSGGGRVDAVEYLRLAERFGANATITKPIIKADILSVIHSLLSL